MAKKRLKTQATGTTPANFVDLLASKLKGSIHVICATQRAKDGTSMQYSGRLIEMGSDYIHIDQGKPIIHIWIRLSEIVAIY